MELASLSTYLPQITSIVSFIVGGGAIAFLKSKYDYTQQQKKDNLAFDQVELGKYKERTVSLEQRLLSLESSMIQSSVPEWRKDCTGRYEYINLAYELAYIKLLPLSKNKLDIIGKTDEEIFGIWPDFVEMIKSLDREAIVSTRKFAIRRNVIFPNREEQVMLIKEVAQTSDGRIVLIGRCYPEAQL